MGLHRNTALDRELLVRKSDPSRDVMPSFERQIIGIPASANPRGAKTAPTYKVVPHSGLTTDPKPPFGLLQNRTRLPLNHRNVPATMRRTFSSPSSLAPLAAEPSEIVNRAAPASPATRLQNTVARANAEAREGRRPTETEVLYKQMQQDPNQ